MRVTTRTTLCLCVLFFLLVACGQQSEPVVQEQETEPATGTPKPTFTPEPEPTGTSAPTATEAPAATAEATATPDYLTTPPEREPSPGRTTDGKAYPPGAYEFVHDQFGVPGPPARVPDEYVASLPSAGEGRCPLTGEAAPEGIGQRRPINVRVDNSPQGRPQAGLDNADVIWETLAEGGITRLTVTFHCRTPGTLGPIRSARLIDLQLTPMLGAWLVHVGAAQPVTDMIWASTFADRSIDEWAGDPAFYRIDQAAAGWLRTYSNNELIQQVVQSQTNRELPAPLRGWRFDGTVPDGSDGGAQGITVPYQAGVVNYRYDASSNRYLRYQGQSPHTTQSGTQLAPDNVLVLFADMTATQIVEDSLGSLSLHFKIYGEGRGLLFRDGQVWDARWVREGENTLIRVVDGDNRVIPLRPGQTVAQIVPSGMNVTWR